MALLPLEVPTGEARGGERGAGHRGAGLGQARGDTRGALGSFPTQTSSGGLWVSMPGACRFALWRRMASGVDFEGWSRVTTGLASTSCLPRGSPGRQRFL